MSKPTLYMLVGLPGSGKSHWASSMKDILKFTIFSSDEYREKLTGNVNDTEHNNLVFHYLHKDLIECLQKGYSVCYDATNVKKRDRTHFLKQIEDIDCAKVAVVIDTSEDIIKYQNDNRDRVVPWEVIERMHNKFVMPTEEEGFDSVITIHRNESCFKCKFYHSLEHNFVVGKGFEHSNCCTMLLELKEKDDADPFIQEVGPLSLCEMFTPKEKTNE